MAKPTTKTVLVLAGLLLLSCSVPSRANSLDAPAVVEADKTGAFSYDAVFTARDNTVLIAGFTIIGPPANNVDTGTLIADCFCPPSAPGCSVDPSSREFVISVAGSLLDPLQNGTVTIQVDLCGGQTFRVTTTVIPHVQPVPTLSEWGMVVLTLLLLVGITIRFGWLRSVLAGASSARITTDANASRVN